MYLVLRQVLRWFCYFSRRSIWQSNFQKLICFWMMWFAFTFQPVWESTLRSWIHDIPPKRTSSTKSSPGMVKRTITKAGKPSVSSPQSFETHTYFLFASWSKPNESHTQLLPGQEDHHWKSQLNTQMLSPPLWCAITWLHGEAGVCWEPLRDV